MNLRQFFSSTTVSLNRYTIIIMLLVVSLIGTLSFIVYQRHAARGTNREPTASAQNDGQSYKPPFNAFLTALKSPTIENKDAHIKLYNYLRTLDQKTFPSSQDLKNFVESNDIPHDYVYFFRECLPAYSRSYGSGVAFVNDPHIILSLPRGKPYKASLFLNVDNLPVEALGQAVNPQASANRIVMSGAYTSPYKLPAGLALDKGRVVNPAIQDFDGLLEVWPEGEMQISHIDALQDDSKTLHIRASFNDYLKFIRLAEQTKLTIIQSNLLINNGDISVKDDPLLKKLQRRVIFQTADDSLHVYDSLDKEETLFEVAQYLKDHYRAQRAINLEAGTYSFCTINKQNHLTNRSNVKVGTVLSNLIVIDF